MRQFIETAPPDVFRRTIAVARAILASNGHAILWVTLSAPPNVVCSMGAWADNSSRSAIILLLTMVAGCETPTIQRSGGTRILTGFEMDQVTAGAAAAVNYTAALALGSAPHASAFGAASAYYGSSPIVGAPLTDYANSQATAIASGGSFAHTSLSSEVSVDRANGGASVGARAMGTGTSQAQVTAQFYGVSTNRTDLVFGSVSAVACCGSNAAAGIEVDSRAGGPYTRELRAAPASETPGQVGNRVDIAVVSSALPLLDAAQVFVAGAPARVSPKY